MTGATTSVRSVNRGVRKMRAVMDEFYLNSNREPVSALYSRVSMHISDEEAKQIYSQARSSMNNIIEILITGTTENGAAKAFQEAFSEVDRLNGTFNKDLKRSNLYKINRKAWKKPIKCDKELFYIIKSSLHYSQITDGGFDITECSSSDALNKDNVKYHKYEDIVINTNKNGSGTIFIKDKQTKLDLSLLANGYVVDKVITILRNNNISHALVNFGGTIRVIGNPPGDTVWKIAIANPATAPYGTKGFAAIGRAGLMDTVSGRLVYGQSVGQTFVFTQTGNAQMGFVALAQALSAQGQKGRYWPIPEAENVDQWGCVSRRSTNRDTVQQLLSFLQNLLDVMVMGEQSLLKAKKFTK